jgi:hypothetical protein
MQKTEKAIQSKILKWLNAQPKTIAFKNFANAYNAHGLPDITGAIAGLRLEIEVKTPTGRLSKKQAYILERYNKFNILAFVARDLEEVQDRLAPVYELISKNKLPLNIAFSITAPRPTPTDQK